MRTYIKLAVVAACGALAAPAQEPSLDIALTQSFMNRYIARYLGAQVNNNAPADASQRLVPQSELAIDLAHQRLRGSLGVTFWNSFDMKDNGWHESDWKARYSHRARKLGSFDIDLGVGITRRAYPSKPNARADYVLDSESAVSYGKRIRLSASLSTRTQLKGSGTALLPQFKAAATLHRKGNWRVVLTPQAEAVENHCFYGSYGHRAVRTGAQLSYTNGRHTFGIVDLYQFSAGTRPGEPVVPNTNIAGWCYRLQFRNITRK